MNNSKLYYIITNFLDVCEFDFKGLYTDIKNGYNGNVLSLNKGWVKYSDIRYLAANKTKKEIKKYFER